MNYTFIQHFNFPPERAYEWCTDFKASDLNLMGETGVRKIERVSEDTLILIDNYASRKSTRKRLVKLYPARLSWTNTRLSEDGRHSQFLYEIVADDNGSKLIFSGSEVVHNLKQKNKIRSLEKKLAEEDAAAWRLLAKEMARDLALLPS